MSEIKLESTTCEETLKKKIKTEQSTSGGVDSPPTDSTTATTTATKSHIARLQVFTKWLAVRLFDPEWEHRHGAASCLREIVKKLVQSLSKSNDDLSEPMSTQHKIWFEACLCKLFQVIALDRFADYIGDETVAPVRETCTQTIGVISRLYTHSSHDITRLCAVINMFLGKDINQWEISHSGECYLLFFQTILFIQKI